MRKLLREEPLFAVATIVAAAVLMLALRAALSAPAPLPRPKAKAAVQVPIATRDVAGIWDYNWPDGSEGTLWLESNGRASDYWNDTWWHGTWRFTEGKLEIDESTASGSSCRWGSALRHEANELVGAEYRLKRRR